MQATFALLRSTAQKLTALELKGRDATRSEAPILIGFVTYGRGHLTDSGRCAAEFADGDLWVCDPATSFSVQFSNDFELLLLCLPRERLVGRFGRAATLPTLVLGETVSAAAAWPLMRALASHFAVMEGGDVMAAEPGIAELVLSALLAKARPEEDNATRVQAAHLSRVCAQIEARLREPDLSVNDIASAEGLSARYIQRLFEGQDRSFSDYVRHRRLEQCRLDLMNPQHADRSITEIGVSSGVPDQAHFSRVFSAAYGISPRDYRKSSGATVETRWTVAARCIRAPASPARHL